MEPRSSRQTTGGKTTPYQKTPRLTPQQMLILAIVTVLGGVALALAAVLMLPGVPERSNVQSSTVVAPALPQPGGLETAQPEPDVQPQLAGCTRVNSGMQTATNTRVIEGGTIEVMVDGNLMQVGFAGILIPENGPLNEQAAKRMRTLAEGQTVTLVRDSTGQDAAGQEVRYIFSGGRFLNLELVQAGLAQADIEGPNQACTNLFQQGEQQARADRSGVWQPTHVPTATFMPMVTLDPALQPDCDCASRPECSSFTNHSDAQACFNACNDYSSRLDEDHDGLACEELP